LRAHPAPHYPTAPIDVDDAVRLAFFNNPRLQAEYARLGLGRADLEDARRLSNPSFGFLRLTPDGSGAAQITRSLSFGLTEVLLLPARKRLAKAELERLQLAVSGAVLAIATEVEVAWFEAVGAQQVAAMRDLVARAGEQSAELAQRFFDAGNLNRLQLERERAAATQARIDALAAGASALRARHRLAGLIGLPTASEWTTQSQLPAPRALSYDAESLAATALEMRLDLAAARKAVALREDALGVSRRWRWLGGVEVGYEHEREFDGNRTRGIFASLASPIFNQGQGFVARAEAELQHARAELDSQLLGVRNDAQLRLDAIATAHTIAERYRIDLVPRREAIVERTQEELNFMLVGVFELLLAKQQQYDAYQAYLESVRDYWVSRAELRGAVGGRLPDDDQPLTPTIGVETILPRTSSNHADHETHGALPTEADSHAGHATPETPTAAEHDPHAGHHSQAPPPAEPSDTSEPHGDHAPSAPDRNPSKKVDADRGEAAHPHHNHGDTP
jgi:cobalt-zinc-cadmium efflux system outer membrane protein